MTKNTVIYGTNAAGDTLHPVEVSSAGLLQVDVVSGGGGGGGDATAANQTTIISNQTDGSQKAKCMGIDTATSLQHQLKVASDGALHIISENFDSMLIKGVETGTTTQRDCKQNANGDLRVQLIANDGNDGTGAMRIVKCDTNGVLETSGGGGGGGGDATAANQVLQLAQETTTATQSTNSATSLSSVDGKITACDTGAVVVSSSALPTGAASEATLSSANANLGNIAAAVSGTEFQCDVVTSALPSGASTSSNQSTMIGSLNNIETNTTGVATSALQTSLNGALASNASDQVRVDIISGAGSSTQYSVGTTGMGSGTGTLLIASNSGTAREIGATALGELSVSDQTTQSSLSSIDGKVTACNTGAVVVSSSALPSGAATESTLDSLRTENATNLGTIATTLDDGTQEARCMGNFSGAQVQIKVDTNGVVETSGGGGSAATNTYNSTTVSVLAPINPGDPPRTTASQRFDLTSVKQITAITLWTVATNFTDVSRVGLEYSYDGTNYFTNLGSAISPSWQTTQDLNGNNRLDPVGGINPIYIDSSIFPDQDKAQYFRVVFEHSNDAGAAVDIVPIIVFGGI